MAFTPRTFEQILEDMIAYVQSRTEISDYNVGSVIRTVLEAAALEDDEQYFQMVQLLDLFSFTTASNEDLDRRLADFGITRRAAVPATTKVRFTDNSLVRTKAAVDVLPASTLIVGADTSKFPTSGYPYTIRVGEGTSRMQNLVVTGNNTTTGELTLSTPTVYDVFLGDRIAFVTGGTLAAPTSPSASARVIPLGTQIQAPATVSEPAKIYTTTEVAFIVKGNYESNEVTAKCTTSGTAGNVGPNRITQFPNSPPFASAGVRNVVKADGGINRESDSEFRARAIEKLQSLSRGTPTALKAEAIGIVDPVTQARVSSSNLVEDFDLGEVILFVDDGTGASAKTRAYPSDTLSAAVTAGGLSISPTNISDWPSSGAVLIETDGVNAAELVIYQSNDGVSLTLETPLALNHLAGSIINFVDLVTTSAEATQRRFQLANFPVVRASERIWIRPPSGVWSLLTREVDYKLNKGTGELQLTDVGGVMAGAAMVAHYTYYTNLIAEVQKVMEGDPNDTATYPGVKAAGVLLAVEQPVLKRVSVLASIIAAPGYVESDLAPQVQRAIESYISSLKIGQDVIVSKIIDSAFAVTGLADITILRPTRNITVLETELPVPFDASGNSLVRVS